MCTVTYIPQGNGNYILTSNRDEQAERSPQNLTQTEERQQQMLFPRDQGAGGTWIATSEKDKVVCLLNGAFEQHERQLPYRMSRGIMVLDFFTFKKAADFFENYSFQGIEPFTMVIIDGDALYDFRWDGEKQYIRPLDSSGQYIWSSTTLYTQEVKQKRRQWFAAWQKEQAEYPTLDSVMHFHQTAGDGDPWNDVIMNRNGLVQTVSITNVIRDETQIKMDYHDLIHQRLKQAQIEVNRELVESR